MVQGSIPESGNRGQQAANVLSDRTKFIVKNISADSREDIRAAAGLALEYWPNAHLGDRSRRQDLRSAFLMLRSWAVAESIQVAVGQLSGSAYRHADM